MFHRGGGRDQDERVITSAGFFVMKMELIFAKWVAMGMCSFMSSGGLSRTVSQKGRRMRDSWLREVSTMDQISLHRTSVAT